MVDLNLPSIGQSNWGDEVIAAFEALNAGKPDTADVSATYVSKVTTHAALVSALAAATAGQTVVLAASVSGAGVTVPADVALVGLGKPTLTVTSGAAGVTLGDRSQVRNLVVDGNGAVGSGVAFGTSTDAAAHDVKIKNNAGGNGFTTGAATRPTLVNCDSDACYYGLLLNGGVVDALVQGGTHTNGVANTSYEGAVYLPNALRSRLIGVAVIDSAGHGFYDMGTDNTFAGCSARSCGTTGDQRGGMTDTSTRSTWVGCTFADNYECGFYDRNTSTGTSLTSCVAKGNNTGLRPGGHGFEMLGANWSTVGCYSFGQLGDAAGEGCGFYLGGAGTSNGDKAVSNYGHGFRLYDSWHVVLSGWLAKNNSQAGAGMYDGVNVDGSYIGATTEAAVTGGHAFDDQGTKTQRYGMSITNKATYSLVVGNVLRPGSHATGGLLDGVGTGNTVANNVTI